MYIVLAILYVLVGMLLAVPYCLLAGWSEENFPMVAFMAPAFLFIWFMLAIFAGITSDWRTAFSKSNRRLLPSSLYVFWAWTIYSFLPIIIHWSAALLEKVGYETVGSLLNTHRYASTFYVFMATFMLLVIISMITSAWDVAKGVWARFAHH